MPTETNTATIDQTNETGTATAGYRGTATAGYRGTATAGYRGTAVRKDGQIVAVRRLLAPSPSDPHRDPEVERCSAST